MKQEPIQEIEELEVIARVQAGDAEAFRHLVNVYEPPLGRYLQRMLNDQESARDLLQETLLAVYRALPHWQPPSFPRSTTTQEPGAERQYLMQHPLAPWLYRIATNLALNYLKRQSTLAYSQMRWFIQDNQLFEQDSRIGMNQVQPDTGPSLEDRYVTREILREALCRLSSEDATCLLLRFVQGERYSEIAARIGISQEAVRKRVTRGLSALRAMYHQLDMETQ